MFRGINKTNNNSRHKIFWIILAILICVSVIGARHNIENYLRSTFLPSKDDIKKVLVELIETDPEFIFDNYARVKQQEADKLQAKMKEKIIEKKELIENSDFTPIKGNKASNISLVYFFDYNCGYCKRSNKTMARIFDKHKNIKIIYKELPILSSLSRYQAKSALAVYALNPEKYFTFHDMLMSKENVNEQEIKQILSKIGINESDFQHAILNVRIDEKLDEINKLASDIGIRGVPAIIINGEMIAGIDEEQIERYIKKFE